MNRGMWKHFLKNTCKCEMKELNLSQIICIKLV